jgi:hypothetical protein
VRAASQGDTIEQTTQELKNVPSSNTIRYHLNKLEDFANLEKEINTALKCQIPKGLKKKKLSLAIDINLIPYYGKPSEAEKPYIYRSQAKQGTCSFYAYATLYVIQKGKRVNFRVNASKIVAQITEINPEIRCELSLATTERKS